MKGYWKFLMMACCGVLERSEVGNSRTGGGVGGHSVCKTASVARMVKLLQPTLCPMLGDCVINGVLKKGWV
jgi:hypothetical protein